MKWKVVAAGIGLALASTSSFASLSCSSTTDWSSLGPPGFESFGNSFTSAGVFHDCYTFSLGATATTFGGLIELNTPLFNKLDIDVTQVSLYLGDSLIGSDLSPLTFSFTGLAGGGTYTLMINGEVSSVLGLLAVPVGYTGSIAAIAGPVQQIPEPGSAALLGLGLACAATAYWRRR